MPPHHIDPQSTGLWFGRPPLLWLLTLVLVLMIVTFALGLGAATGLVPWTALVVALVPTVALATVVCWLLARAGEGV